MDLALFVLRAVVGLFFIGHGAQKLFGSFGGHGLTGTAGFFDAIGIRPGHLHALAAGWAELGAGVLLVLGLLSPLAAVLVIAVMTTAIIAVHASKGPWVTEGGWEYNAVLMAVAFTVAGAGPGEFSLDNALGWMEDITGTGWALGALGVGILGGAGAIVAGRAERGPATAPAEPVTPVDTLTDEPVAGRRFVRDRTTAAQDERPGIPADPR